MLCEIAGIEPTCCTMNPIKQMLRSSQTGAFCLKHKKINEENSSHAIASKIDINTISITSMIKNILNAFFMFLPPLSFLRSTINCSGSAPTYVPPTTAGLSPRRRLPPPSMAACSYTQIQSPSTQLSLRDNKHVSL